MELNEIMRLLWQALVNTPRDAPERDKAVRAYGALTSRLDYKPPANVLVLREDGFREFRHK